MATIDYDFDSIVALLKAGSPEEEDVAYEFSDGTTFERDPNGIEEDSW